MKFYFTFVFLLLHLLVSAQDKGGEIFNYRMDAYWEDVKYESKWQDYIYLSNDSIFKQSYETHYVEITGDTIKSIADSTPPYKHLKSSDTIYIEFFDIFNNKKRKSVEYLLNTADTVDGLISKASLDSKAGVSAYGYSTYVKDTIIQVAGRSFKTHLFKVFNKSPITRKVFYCKDLYLDSDRLIPILEVIKLYDKNSQPNPYHCKVILHQLTDTVPQFYMEEELIIYRDASLNWSKEQLSYAKNMLAKDAYIEEFSEAEEITNCVIERFKGDMNFYDFCMYYTHKIDRMKAAWIFSQIQKCVKKYEK